MNEAYLRKQTDAPVSNRLVGLVLLAVVVLTCGARPVDPPDGCCVNSETQAVPVLQALKPASGPPGTVVEVVGEHLDQATVLWSEEAPTRSDSLPSSFLGARFFTVPRSAKEGSFNVRLFGDGVFSEKMAGFMVEKELPLSAEPRLDDVTLYGFHLTGEGASMLLLAHGANIDVGAEIRISTRGTTDVITRAGNFSRLLRNNLREHPASLGYPILHYATVWAPLERQRPGSNLVVQVCNGEVCSNRLPYRLPMSLADLDSDGDGLLDRWENNDPDDDDLGVDLHFWGARPYRKDLFLEVDWMEAEAWSGRPHESVWTRTEQAFARAPVLNSDGSQGIALHIDRGQGGGRGGTALPFKEFITFNELSVFSSEQLREAAVSMKTLMADSANFDPRRKGIYRYAVFGWDDADRPGRSGKRSGDAFYVTLGQSPMGTRADIQLGTFLHEFGHTLGLQHGGDENQNRSKDNYNSVMQRGNRWMPNPIDDWFDHPGPSQFGGIDADCNLLTTESIFTFSEGMRAPLNTENLPDPKGICILREESLEAAEPIASGGTFRDVADWALIVRNMRDGAQRDETIQTPSPSSSPAPLTPLVPETPSSTLILPDAAPREVQSMSLPEEVQVAFRLFFEDKVLCEHEASLLKAMVTRVDPRKREVTFFVDNHTYGSIDTLSGAARLEYRLPNPKHFRFEPDVGTVYDVVYEQQGYGELLGYVFHMTTPDGKPVLVAGRLFGGEPLRYDGFRGSLEGMALAQRPAPSGGREGHARLSVSVDRSADPRRSRDRNDYEEEDLNLPPKRLEFRGEGYRVKIVRSRKSPALEGTEATRGMPETYSLEFVIEAETIRR